MTCLTLPSLPIPGPENVTPNSFSRVDAFCLYTKFDLRELVEEQKKGEQPAELLAKNDHSLKLQRLT